MIHIRNLSLRGKSLLFLIGYTLILEGAILAFFYYSEQGAIRRRSQQDVQSHAALARAAVERGLTDSLAELAGLRAQLAPYPLPLDTHDSALKPLQELVVASPQKYVEIGLLHRGSRRLFAVHAVSELNTIYPTVESRIEQEAAGECPGDGAPCVLASRSGQRGELLTVVVPLTPESPAILVAHLRLEFLLEAIGRLATPPNVSVLAANRSGLILYAADVSLLRTYLRNSVPRLAWPSNNGRPPGPAFERLPDRAVRWEHLRRPEVLLAVEKDERADIHDLRMTLLSVASFATTFTLLAVLGVWALTGRLAALLRHVAEVANSVAGGDFSRRIAIRRNDELGVLAASFDSMTVRLEESYRSLQSANLQLQRKVEELIRTRRRLSQKQRLALMGKAISSVSHEIQNKIGGAGVWVQNLERFGSKDDNTTLCVRELKTALASSLDMLAHFKRFYREPQLTRTTVPAGDLIGSCLGRVATGLQRKELSVVTDLGAEPASLDVDPAQMTDAIVNILLNAIHVSPEHGTLYIGLTRDDRQAILSFRDEGPGLESTDRLFQPFYTTKPAGSGLGLAIVRNIVRAHAGRVRAFNSVEGGACFEIRLPHT